MGRSRTPDVRALESIDEPCKRSRKLEVSRCPTCLFDGRRGLFQSRLGRPARKHSASAAGAHVGDAYKFETLEATTRLEAIEVQCRRSRHDHAGGGTSTPVESPARRSRARFLAQRRRDRAARRSRRVTFRRPSRKPARSSEGRASRKKHARHAVASRVRIPTSAPSATGLDAGMEGACNRCTNPQLPAQLRNARLFRQPRRHWTSTTRLNDGVDLLLQKELVPPYADLYRLDGRHAPGLTWLGNARQRRRDDRRPSRSQER